MISKSSRYAAAQRASLVRADGSEVHYAVPPVLPHPDDHARAQLHRVTDSDRPDTLAARAYGQATAWYLLANANTVAHPDQLTETPGTGIDIPLPEGMR